MSFGTREREKSNANLRKSLYQNGEGRQITADEVKSRRDRGVEMVREHGGETEALYYGVGQYDFVGVFDFPDTESLAKAQTAYEQLGLSTMESFEVFSPEEWDSLLESALE